MIELSEIVYEVEVLDWRGPKEQMINHLSFDSRKLRAGDLFVAVKGTQVDGHKFIAGACEKDIRAVVCEKFPVKLDTDISYILVQDSAKALGQMASAFFGHPSRKLKLVGVTGTNGKTTIATLLHSLFNDEKRKSGLLSTIRNYIGDKEVKATHTTPDAVSINKLLAGMVDENVEYCFMEVSSHAVVQERISGLHFTGGIFTNITHDHLDFHGSFDNYIKAKKKFFDELPPSAFALINIDDKNSKIVVQNTAAPVYTYGLRNIADFKAKIIESTIDGTLMKIDNAELWTLFTGRFNAYNLCAVYASAALLGEEKEELLRVISQLKPVEGRFETIRSGSGITAIVDYAHTPDALENVIKTLVEVQRPGQQLITVVGTGGNRDKSKRPVMAKIAVSYSQKVVLTSDNPRNEEPAAILKDMMEGVPVEKKKDVLTISERKEGIRTACMLAQKGDIILIAGKGHETYQEVKGVRHHFDDREVVKEVFAELNS